MKLVFFGSGSIGRASLRALIEGGRAPLLVVSQPPRRRRRRGRPEPTPVHAAADDAGIETVTPAKVREAAVLDRLRAAQAELFAVADFGQLLPQDLLDIPPLGTINMHPSLLPRHRGAAPVAAAILAGDEETGVTIHRTVMKLDAGPILAARTTAIEPDEDAGGLSERLAALGGALLLEVVEAFAAGQPPPDRPQDEARVTHCGRFDSSDASIDWTEPADVLARKVRAFSPWPGSRAELAREPPLPLLIRRARAAEGEAEPGTVAVVARDHFDVGTGAGVLRVLELVPAAKRPMDARAFLNGYRLQVGERLA